MATWNCSALQLTLLDNIDPSDPAQVRNQALGELAFLEFAAMRGLESKKYAEAPWVIKLFNDHLGVLTQEDKTHIRERAKAIYDDLEDKRRALNLGSFEDIENPNLHNKFFPEYDPTKDYIKTMGENAF